MPSDSSKRLQLIVDKELKARIDAALKDGENRSALIRKAVETEVCKRERRMGLEKERKR